MYTVVWDSYDEIGRNDGDGHSGYTENQLEDALNNGSVVEIHTIHYVTYIKMTEIELVDFLSSHNVAVHNVGSRSIYTVS